MAEKLGRVLVTGKLYWPYLTYKNGNKYTVDIGGFNEADTAKLEALAAEAGKTKNKFLKAKEGHPSGGQYIICQSQSEIKSLFFPDGTPLSDAELSKVGNGTEVLVRIGGFVTSSEDYGRNIGANLLKAKVTEAVWYGADDSDMFDEGVVAVREAVSNDTEAPTSEGKGDVTDLLSDLDDEVPFGQEEVA